MDTQNIRVNISVPKRLIDAVDRFAGKRKRSLFVAEALRAKIEQLEKEQLEQRLAEGYRESRKQGIELAAEFESADLENWDEF